MPARRCRPPAFALLLCAAFAGEAGAQVAPGGDGVSASRFRSEYYADVLEGVNRAMGAWADAVSGDRGERIGELYTGAAVLLPPEGGTVRGIEAVRAWFGEAFPRLGTVEAFMQDFDASGGIAVLYGSYLLEVRGEGGTLETRSGPLFTVLVREGRTWRIRFQAFHEG